MAEWTDKLSSIGWPGALVLSVSIASAAYLLGLWMKEKP